MTQAKMKARTPRKVIWAINPFDEKDETRAHVLAQLRELGSQGAEIEPVYVLSPEEYEVNVAFNAPWLRHIRPTAEKVLNHSMKDVKASGLSGLRSPQILVEKRPSLSCVVETLARYAKRTRAEVIVVGTHTKNPLSRFFMGSFTETLLLHSRVPVLVVGARAEDGSSGKKSLQGSGKTLFPTDFSPSSEKAFKKLLSWVKAQGGSVTLFHRQPHPVEPLLQSGVYLLGGGVVSFPEFMTHEEQKKRKIAARWIRFAKQEGVRVEAIWSDGQGSTAQAIVERARAERAERIAMAAQSGSLTAAFVGSVTRQVVRSATCPIWVMRAGR